MTMQSNAKPMPIRCMLLMMSMMTVPGGVFGAPIASSYKSTASITSLGPGTSVCPAGQIPVAVSGNGVDYLGKYTLTEQMCADPLTRTFSGRFEVRHGKEDCYSGPFNGTFFPSGEVMEVHAAWRIAEGDGAFAGAVGAGTAKGVATVVNGGPGPGEIVLDGSILISGN
jgi:hypothetical protein